MNPLTEALKAYGWQGIDDAPHDETCEMLGIWSDQCSYWKAQAETRILEILKAGTP